MRSIACVIALAGCGGADPSIAFLSPQDGDVVCGSDLEIELRIDNFELVPLSEGEVPEDGRGHVDLALNGQVVSMDAGDVFKIDLDPGEWQLRAELVHANHTPVEPYAGDLIYVTADPEACTQ